MPDVDEASGSGHGDSSSPRSTGDLPKGSPAARKELGGAVAAGVTAATSMAHELLADDAGKAFGLYLAEDEEVEGIADATAGLLSRRVPAGVGSPDAADIFRLGLILAGYIGRQFRIRRQLKAARMGALTTGHDVDEDTEGWAA